MLQALHHLHGFSLDSLPYVHVSLVLGSPELNTEFQLWPHQHCLLVLNLMTILPSIWMGISMSWCLGLFLRAGHTNPVSFTGHYTAVKGLVSFLFQASEAQNCLKINTRINNK